MGKVSPSNSHVMWMCVYVYSKITWHLSIFIKYQWYWLPVSQRFQAMVRHCLQEQRVFLDASDCPWCLCIKKQIQQHVTCLAMLPGNLTCGPSTGQSQQRRSQPAWSTEDEDRSELLGFPIHACVHLYSVVCPSTINVVCSSIIDFRA